MYNSHHLIYIPSLSIPSDQVGWPEGKRRVAAVVQAFATQTPQLSLARAPASAAEAEAHEASETAEVAAAAADALAPLLQDPKFLLKRAKELAVLLRLVVG